MNKIRTIILSLFALTLCSSLFLSAYAEPKSNSIVEAYSSQENGIFFSTEGFSDLPPTELKSKEAFERYIDFACKTLKIHQVETLYYDTILNGKASYKSKYLGIKDNLNASFDPLEIVSRKAKENGINLVCVIDPNIKNKNKEFSFTDNYFSYEWQNNELVSKIIREISSSYKLDGILITNLLNSNNIIDNTISDEILNTIATIYNSARQANPSLTIGAYIPKNSDFKIIFSESMQHLVRLTDYFVVDIDASNQKLYGVKASYWTEFCKDNKKGIFITNKLSYYKKPITSENIDISCSEALNRQIFIGNQLGSNGIIFDSFKSLAFDLDYTASLLSASAIEREIQASNISKNKFTLDISSPPYEDRNSFRTNHQKINIIGTSDPTENLYVNGSLINNDKIDGYFVYEASLKNGENVFQFRQSNKVKNISITYNDSESDLSEYTAFPTYDEPCYPNEELIVQFVAPRGYSIFANVNNVLYKLEETFWENNIATYSGRLSFPEPKNDIENLGKITYIISDGKYITNKQSEGELILIRSRDANCTINSKFTPLYKYNNGSIKIGTLSEGTVGRITDISNDYVNISGLGYVSRNDIDISYQQKRNKNEIQNILLQSSEDMDIISIVGTSCPPYKIGLFDDFLTVRLLEAENLPETLEHLKNEFISDILIDNENGVLTINLAEPSRLLGYTANYNNNILEIKLMHKPSRAEKDLPLSDITVLIDASQNGTKTDPICPDGSPAGIYNLHTSYLLSHYLDALGANVYMTRSNADALSIYDRTIMAEKIKPDLIISINNECEYKNALEKSNISIGYDISNKYSEKVAESFYNGICDSLDGIDISIFPANSRNNKIIESSLCPSISLSFGNLSNPSSYSQLTESKNINDIVFYVSNLIVKHFN